MDTTTSRGRASGVAETSEAQRRKRAARNSCERVRTGGDGNRSNCGWRERGRLAGWKGSARWASPAPGVSGIAREDVPAGVEIIGRIAYSYCLWLWLVFRPRGWPGAGWQRAADGCSDPCSVSTCLSFDESDGHRHGGFHFKIIIRDTKYNFPAHNKIKLPSTTKSNSRPKHNQQHNQKQSDEDDISNLNESSNPVRKIAFPCEAGG
ncbi:hypothetical protein ACI2TD_19400 [Ralstonia nicotianae]